MTNIFSITNISGFAETIRTGAAESIAENYREDLNDFVTLQQVEKMIEDKCLGLDDCEVRWTYCGSNKGYC